jgi:hypothetical protein
MKCPKCGYVRSQSDTGPAGECPSCGIIYSKFDPAAEARRVELANKAASRAARAPKQEAPAASVVDDASAKRKRMALWGSGVALVLTLVGWKFGPALLPLLLVIGVFVVPLIFMGTISKARHAQRVKKEAALLEQSPLMHCMSCGTEFKKPIKGPLRGSDGIEIALWILAFWAFVPVVYSIWRRSSKTFRPACPACGSSEVVPESTPGAQAHKRQIAV